MEAMFVYICHAMYPTGNVRLRFTYLRRGNL